MDNNDIELELLPVDPEVATRERARSDLHLQNAAHLLEYEEICAEEEEKRDLRFSDLGTKFGIRHIIVLTSVSAAVVSLFVHLGPAAGIAGLVAGFLIVGWFCVQDWQTQFEIAIGRRKLAWRKRSQRRVEPQTRLPLQ